MLRSKTKKTILTLKCVDCGNSYSLSDLEVQKFESTKSPFPKRCKSCRRLSVIEKGIKVLKKIILKSAHESEPHPKVTKATKK